MKAELSRLIPQKLTADLGLLMVNKLMKYWPIYVY